MTAKIVDDVSITVKRGRVENFISPIECQYKLGTLYLDLVTFYLIDSELVKIRI